VELELGGRRCRLTALVDTGNTLTDPVTGRPVLVAEGEKLTSLFPAGECPTQAQLSDPVATLTARRGEGYHWRLLPYQAVGVSHALLLAVKVDRARVGQEDYGSILVALAPGRLSDGGGYSALIGM
jgi:stage II sporulation protein GA (sporulation sigma-E factor processing peptidase)